MKNVRFLERSGRVGLSVFVCFNPMVISADKEIEVIPLECAETVVYVDGQVTMDFKNNCALRIKKADYKLKLVNMEPRYFFETIMKRLRRSDEDLF